MTRNTVPNDPKAPCSTTDTLQIPSIGTDVGVALVQLSSPFFNELDIGQDPDFWLMPMTLQEHTNSQIPNLPERVISRNKKKNESLYASFKDGCFTSPSQGISLADAIAERDIALKRLAYTRETVEATKFMVAKYRESTSRSRDAKD